MNADCCDAAGTRTLATDFYRQMLIFFGTRPQNGLLTHFGSGLPCQAALLRGKPASNPLCCEGRGGVRVFGRKDLLQVVPADPKSIATAPR